MRVGMNPMRSERAAEFKPIALTAVTHLPNLQGYHARRLEVIQVCLLSMVKHANEDHNLIIWDNGSCPELLEWIEGELKPDVLIKSVNVGKTAARTCLTRMVHPKTIVTYTDDDMLFYPNWLKPQIELLQGFPCVSVVTGYPVRTSFRWGNEKTLRWAKKNAKIERGRFLPDAWERDFAISIGRDPSVHFETSKDDQDVLIEYNGMKAYATSHHCQFIGYSEMVGRVTQYDGFAMGDERPFDVALDSVGLRLATIDRSARHMGNIIHDELRDEITRMKL